MSFPNVFYAQCSDAGVCVVGSRHALMGHRVSVGYVFGKSGKTDDLTIHSFQIEGDIQLFHDSRLTVRLPWSRTSGPLGHTGGIGDLTLLWNQTVWEAIGGQLSVQAGGKFATGNANSADLPQAYQPGLGTNDLLLGISYDTEPWLFAFGYQRSRERSNNSITRLQRGDDLLARIGYNTHAGDLTVGLEILAIKRLQEASVLNAAIAGGNSFTTISGSDQFQANLLATVSLPFSESYSISGFAAVPLRGRNVNVDGLTRSITLSVAIQYLL
jgi:hypothetical protein